MRRVVYTALTAVTAVVLLVGAWLLFAPAQFGGSTRYAVVDGVSMEPGLSRGDLVVVRPGSRPAVGDVVLYRNTMLGVRVLHRVVRVEGDRVVLQGDANDFVDDVQPTASEVLGSYWFAVPRVGVALIWMQVPLHAAVLAFLLSLVALSGGAAVRPGAKGELTSA